MMSSAPSRPSLHRASLLDLEPDLAHDLGPEQHQVLRRQTLVPSIALRPGLFDPQALGGDGGVPRGFLVLHGLVVRDLRIAGGVASDLLGPGDILCVADPEDALVPVRTRWTSCSHARVALIDDGVLAVLERTPALAGRLLLRAARQVTRLAVLRGVSQLPRVEQRLLALFWLLAERWGRVTADGVVVPIAVTHETLGRMVGARRPTVSLALKELAQEGSIARRRDGSWILDRSALDRLQPPELDVAPPDAALLPLGGAAA
jgi:CRP-like cAMP-binding protein